MVSSEEVKKYRRCRFNIKNALIVASMQDLEDEEKISHVLTLTLRKDYVYGEKACMFNEKQIIFWKRGRSPHTQLYCRVSKFLETG